MKHDLLIRAHHTLAEELEATLALMAAEGVEPSPEDIARLEHLKLEASEDVVSRNDGGGDPFDVAGVFRNLKL